MAEVPWAHCYPPVPDDFEWEPFINFIPLIVIMCSLAFVFVAIFARGRNYMEKLVLFYLFLSVFIHFGLERYYAHHSGDILNKDNNNLFARIWRHYGAKKKH